MLLTYFTGNENVYEKLENYLSGLLTSPFEILRTENGKPCLEGAPLFFSVSHSGDKALIVICDRPVGADLEIVKKRKYSSVLARFAEQEKKEITGT